MRLSYLISADYARTTGGWVYNERMLKELASLGWTVNRIELGSGFPDPDEAAAAAARGILDGMAPGTLVLADQVVLSPLADVLPEHAGRLRFAMIMHHPQVLEASRSASVAARLDAQERAALKLADRVIATSRLTARQIIETYGVDPARLVTAEPGTDISPPSPGSGKAGPHLLSLGSVIPRKRHELIIAALTGLAGLDWRLTIAGNLAMNPMQVDKLRGLIESHGLTDRIDLLGELTGPHLESIWRNADLYVASSVHEGFGMAVAEAIARQIPVVTTRSGAVGSWLDPRASILVEPDDVATMRAALRRVLTDPGLRDRMRTGTVAARAALATWDQSAAVVSSALLSIV